MKKSTTTTITRDDLTKTFQACRDVEGEIWKQLQKQKISDTSPSEVVNRALEQLERPHWIDEEAWNTMIRSVSGWAQAHGSLSVWKAAGAMKAPELHRFLYQRRKESDRREEARYLFANMEAELIGDEEML
jgi:hypothetical protein